jgi:hypothetical protein
MKKPNLKTLAELLDQKGVYCDHETGHTVKFTLSGFFSVYKHGQTRLYSRLRDAWTAL